MTKWTSNSFYINCIIVCFSKMSSSWNKFVFRNKYWLKIKFSSNRNFNFLISSSELNLWNRYFLSSSFFHTIKFRFISFLILKKKLLCYFIVDFFRHMNRIRKMIFFFIFAICLNLLTKNAIDVSTESKFMIFVVLNLKIWFLKRYRFRFLLRFRFEFVFALWCLFIL